MIGNVRIGRSSLRVTLIREYSSLIREYSTVVIYQLPWYLGRKLYSCCPRNGGTVTTIMELWTKPIEYRIGYDMSPSFLLGSEPKATRDYIWIRNKTDTIILVSSRRHGHSLQHHLLSLFFRTSGVQSLQTQQKSHRIADAKKRNMHLFLSFLFLQRQDER